VPSRNEVDLDTAFYFVIAEGLSDKESDEVLANRIDEYEKKGITDSEKEEMVNEYLKENNMTKEDLDRVFEDIKEQNEEDK